MSMINDALKRAQKQSPSAASGPQLRPAEPSQLANRTLVLMVPVLLVFAVLIGVFFLWQAFQNPRRPQPVKAKTVPAETQQPVVAQQPALKPAQQSVPAMPSVPKVAVPPALKVVQQSVPTVPTAPKVVPQPVKPVQLAMAPVPKPRAETPKPISVPAPVPEKAPAPVAQPAPVAPAPPATPVKLQAIFYSPGHSTAMINGKTVAVGDALKEWRIVSITQTSVRIISFTRTNVLTLPVQ